MALLLGVGALAGCSSPKPRVSPVLSQEQSAVAVLKTKYKGVVLGTDVQHRTLVLYVDVNDMYSMDEDAEAAMKADALERWKSIWAKAHPHAHGSVQLSLRDYYGKEIYRKSAAV